MANERDELEPVERDALRSWGQDWEPPADLRNRTLESLRSRGAIRAAKSGARNGRGTRSWTAMAAAAAIVAFLGGLAVGNRTVGGRDPAASSEDASAAGDRYMLLLFESAEYQNAATSEGQLARVSEYGEWAGATARSGRFVTGEKLAEDGRWCRVRGGEIEILDPAADAAKGVLAGFFTISAASYDDAIRIARDCPHLKYGGTVEVRRIEPT